MKSWKKFAPLWTSTVQNHFNDALSILTADDELNTTNRLLYESHTSIAAACGNDEAQCGERCVEEAQTPGSPVEGQPPPDRARCPNKISAVSPDS